LLVVVVTMAGVRVGMGPVLNVHVIGAVLNFLLALPWLGCRGGCGSGVPGSSSVPGIVMSGFGCATYVGARLGSGPREG
jgi:uncharacterized membrane protein YczE